MAKTKDTTLPDDWTYGWNDDGTVTASKWFPHGQLTVQGADEAEVAELAKQADKDATAYADRQDFAVKAQEAHLKAAHK